MLRNVVNASHHNWSSCPTVWLTIQVQSRELMRYLWGSITTREMDFWNGSNCWLPGERQVTKYTLEQKKQTKNLPLGLSNDLWKNRAFPRDLKLPLHFLLLIKIVRRETVTSTIIFFSVSMWQIFPSQPYLIIVSPSLPSIYFEKPHCNNCPEKKGKIAQKLL